jgi:hypothetical protein
VPFYAVLVQLLTRDSSLLDKAILFTNPGHLWILAWLGGESNFALGNKLIIVAKVHRTIIDHFYRSANYIVDSVGAGRRLKFKLTIGSPQKHLKQIC